MAANENGDYAFYLPIVAFIWQHVIKYSALVLLVGRVWLNPPPGSRLEVVAEALREQKGVKLQVIASDDQFNTAALAQVARLYACLADGIHDQDYLLTTDADLIPLSKAHFSSDRNWNRSIHLYNSFCCAPLHLAEGGIQEAKHNCSQVQLGASDVVRGGGVDEDHRLLHLPISYAGAAAATWRELMGLSHDEERELREGGVTDLLRLAIESRLLNDLGPERARMNLADNHRHADMDMWHLDQRVLSAKVAAWHRFPGDTEMTSRYGHRDRVDRMHWRVPESLEGYIDAHLPQPGFSHENWQATRPLIQLLLEPLDQSKEMMQWIDKYVSAFVAAYAH